MGTGLGRAVLVLVSALYLSRAAEEFFLFQFTPAIFASCVLVGAIYVALLVISIRERRAPLAMTEAAGTGSTEKASERRPAA
jgi:hypothetical protein